MYALHFKRRVAIEPGDQPDHGGIVMSMKLEINRLESYRNWPVRFMDPANLAKAGFYFTHEDDCVRCAFCNIVLHKWEEGDDAMEEHQKWSKNCPFVQGRNIPSIVNSIPRPEGHDVRGRLPFQIMPNSLPERETARLPPAYGFPHNGGPVYPNYAMLNQRMQSFNNWPSGNNLRPVHLGPAIHDRTVSFYSRGVLNNWEGYNKPSDYVPLYKICYLSQVGVMFIPCRHTMACVYYALALDSCPFCREPIQAVVRGFLC